MKNKWENTKNIRNSKPKINCSILGDVYCVTIEHILLQQMDLFMQVTIISNRQLQIVSTPTTICT